MASEVETLRAALEIIAEWKLPETGLFWDDEKTRPVSYQTEHGSDGAQRYMRGIARAALEATAQQVEPARDLVLRAVVNMLEKFPDEIVSNELFNALEAARHDLEASGPAHKTLETMAAEAALEQDPELAKPTNKMVECSICEGDPDRCDIHDCGDAHNTVNPYRNADEGLYGPEYQGQQTEVNFHDVLKLAKQINQSLSIIKTNWTQAMLVEFMAAYDIAVHNKLATFKFNGQEYLVSYAKYLIQYLEGKMP